MFDSFLSVDFSFSSFAENARAFFSGFGFRDAVDILLLSLIFFAVYKFISFRRMGAMLTGAAIYLCVAGIARLLGLTAVDYILSSFFGYGLIALVIIFQPEIRDAFEKIGINSIKSIKNVQKERGGDFFTMIDILCETASELSRTKTGALIVIERIEKLNDVIRTGVEIDAKVSSVLLRNIFFNKAPLHDGAVVIKDNRIAAAGCLLQLTHRSDVDPDLGTRHRAAIGMSEISDAIVIVVSEETGIISVAHNRELTRDYTSKTLKTFLVNQMANNFITASDSKEDSRADLS